MTPANETADTLVSVLSAAAAENTCGVRFLHDTDDTSKRFGYAEILSRSLRAAAYFRSIGIKPGDHVPIIFPTSPTFLSAFYGAILAGAIPCPISMPQGFGSVEGFVERLVSVCRYVGARHVAASEELVAGGLPMALPGIHVIGSEAIEDAPVDAGFTPHAPDPEDVAFLQCTSGSTAMPKGVMLSHRNLVANTRQIIGALSATRDDVLVSWLPLNHDMGLIGAVLFPLMAGFDAILMSPSKFIRRPAVWLRTMSEFRGTVSPAPNFGYGFATARIRDTDLVGVDLSSWRRATCGAEPIDCGTLRAFIERFGAYGFRAEAMAPCYGLAEASVAVSFQRGAFEVDTVDRQALSHGEIVAAEPGTSSVTLAACGIAVPGTRIRIVDEAGVVLPDGRVGHIQVSGPSVMKGYYNLPVETAAVLKDGWLDTGDLGYLVNGDIRITGRTKDVIIIRGKKYHPTEFEWAAEQAEGVRRGTAVGFGVMCHEHARELLYVVCESDAPEEALDGVRARIFESVARRTGIRPDRVLVTRVRRAVQKTTSGKLARAKTKEMVLAVGASPWRVA